eukprot:gene54252-biopygen45019
MNNVAMGNASGTIRNVAVMDVQPAKRAGGPPMRLVAAVKRVVNFSLANSVKPPNTKSSSLSLLGPARPNDGSGTAANDEPRDASDYGPGYRRVQDGFRPRAEHRQRCVCAACTQVCVTNTSTPAAVPTQPPLADGSPTRAPTSGAPTAPPTPTTVQPSRLTPHPTLTPFTPGNPSAAPTSAAPSAAPSAPAPSVSPTRGPMAGPPTDGPSPLPSTHPT